MICNARKFSTNIFTVLCFHSNRLAFLVQKMFQLKTTTKRKRSKTDAMQRYLKDHSNATSSVAKLISSKYLFIVAVKDSSLAY